MLLVEESGEDPLKVFEVGRKSLAVSPNLTLKTSGLTADQRTTNGAATSGDATCKTTG